jgi:hypothetical protein
MGIGMITMTSGNNTIVIVGEESGDGRGFAETSQLEIPEALCFNWGAIR